VTRALTEEVCMETLQAAIHDWLDLHARRRQTFPGVTVTAIPVTYRDFGTTYWDVQIAPSGGLRPAEVEVGDDEQAGSPAEAQGERPATAEADAHGADALEPAAVPPSGPDLG
jgi:hypothetical protein